MRASYELTIDDLAAFVIFHHGKSPAAHRQTTGCLTAVALIMFATPTLLAVLHEKPFEQAIAGLWPLFLIPFLFLAFTIPFIKWQTAKMSHHLLREGRNIGFYGHHSLLLDDDGLHESKEAGETFRKWAVVERFIITPTHLFIYTSGVEAFVVPRHAFSADEEAKTFCQFISMRSGVAPQYL